MDVSDRFWSKVDRREPDECWPWIAGRISSGYGGFHPSKGETITAHRYAYIAAYGQIEDGLVIDHQCHNETACQGGLSCEHRLCCNPAHLHSRTNDENLRAGPNHNSKKTKCPRGHTYTEANTYYAPRRPDSRRCRTCAREADAARPPRKGRRG